MKDHGAFAELFDAMDGDGKLYMKEVDAFVDQESLAARSQMVLSVADQGVRFDRRSQSRSQAGSPRDRGARSRVCCRGTATATTVSAPMSSLTGWDEPSLPCKHPGQADWSLRSVTMVENAPTTMVWQRFATKWAIAFTSPRSGVSILDLGASDFGAQNDAEAAKSIRVAVVPPLGAGAPVWGSTSAAADDECVRFGVPNLELAGFSDPAIRQVINGHADDGWPWRSGRVPN